MKLTSKGKRTVERVAELALPPGGNIWVKVSALVFFINPAAIKTRRHLNKPAASA